MVEGTRAKRKPPPKPEQSTRALKRKERSDMRNLQAVLKIKDAGKFRKASRHKIVSWLRWNANALERDGADYAPHFISKFLVPKRKSK
jgi:hypothetical protein